MDVGVRFYGLVVFVIAHYSNHPEVQANLRSGNAHSILARVLDSGKEVPCKGPEFLALKLLIGEIPGYFPENKAVRLVTDDGKVHHGIRLVEDCQFFPGECHAGRPV